MKRKLFLTVSTAILVLTGSILALAQGDTTPPTLVTLEFNPTTVDTTFSSQLITFTVRLTDDLSGVTDGQIGGIGVSPSQARFTSPSGSQIADVLFSPPRYLTSGDALDGVYVNTLSLSQFSEAGTWRLEYFYLVDDVGNSISLYPADLNARGVPTEFEVESTSDTAPPSLADFSLMPKEVDASSGPQLITVTVRLTDDLSGITDGMIGGIGTSPSQARFASPSGNQIADVLFSSARHLISGTILDGEYANTLMLPQYCEGGLWQLQSFLLVDDVGNKTTLSATDLSSQGFSPVFTVTSQGDFNPPVLADLNFSPDTIDLEGKRLVTVTARLTDDLSGITDGMIGGIGRSPSQARFFSPSGSQMADVLFYPPNHLISGTVQDGIYRGQLTLPYYSENGIWRLESFLLVDDVGNSVTLSQRDLVTKSLPAELLVGKLIPPNEKRTVSYNDLEAGVPTEDLTTTLEFPANALTQTMRLAYTSVPTTGDLPPGYDSADRAFDLSAYRNRVRFTHFNFNEPVTLTLNYTAANVVGLDVDKLILAYWDGQAWVDITDSCSLSSYQRDPTHHKLKVAICHLSHFALLGPKQPGVYLPVILHDQ